MAVTLHFQSTGTVPGDGRPVTMAGLSMTVGRGSDNDLVLPDPSRTVSGRHCAIEVVADGSVVVIDMSANGTFLNYADRPLGSGSVPLNDGDILTIGPYELLVQIGAATGAVDRPAPGFSGSVAPAMDDFSDMAGTPGDDFLADLLGEAPTGPRGIPADDPAEGNTLPAFDEDDLLAPDPASVHTGASEPFHSHAGEDHISLAPGSIPDDWDDFLDPTDPSGPTDPTDPSNPSGTDSEGGGRPTHDDRDDVTHPPSPSSDPFATEGPSDWTLEETRPPAAAPPAAKRSAAPVAAAPVFARPASDAPASDGDAQAGAAAFLRGAGAGHLKLGDDPEVVLERLGGIFRTMVEGLREVLMTRSSIKGEFDIDQTRIASGGNNPLKFSVDPEQALEAMISPRSRGYLDPSAAAEEAMNDIKSHEVATVAGMEAALKGVLQQLSPETLAGRIETGGGLGSMFKGKKARYWEVYEKMYSEIADQAETDFHDLYAREFARAYMAQLKRLKR